MNEIAWLIYKPLKKRRKDESFDNYDNIGAKVIIDVLNRNGYELDYTDIYNVVNYKLVLISFTSQYDIIKFYKDVNLLEHWQRGKRKFKVLCGGFGLQNPTTIRNFIDYAFFGRAENDVVSIVQDILDNKTINHENVMNLPDIHKVKIKQVNELYPHPLKMSKGRGISNQFNEDIIGCSEKCKFCHYTWSRKAIIKDNQSVYEKQSLYVGTPEFLLREIKGKIKDKKYGTIITALDGFSERLRFAWGKKISNELLIDTLSSFDKFEKTTLIKMYNIGSYPCETEHDRREIYDIMKKVNNKSRVVLTLHTTPFRPSLITPMYKLPVNIEVDFKNRYKKYTKKEDYGKNYISSEYNDIDIVNNYGGFTVYHDYKYNESNWSQLQWVIIDMSTKDTDSLMSLICNNKKFDSLLTNQKVEFLKRNFDLSQYIKHYELDEAHPAWFLESYSNIKAIEKIGEKKYQELLLQNKKNGWI